jgi:hypothetical protein
MMPRTVPSVETAANRLIRHLLVSLLHQASCAALVCLNVIDTDDKQWELDRPYFRVTSSAGLGRRPGSLARQMPFVPNWEALLPSLHAGCCPVLRGTGPVPGWPSPTATSRTLVCPAADPLGDLVGAVFIVFDGRNGAPRGADLRHVTNAAARVGGQIAAVLDLAGRVRARAPQTEAA